MSDETKECGCGCEAGDHDHDHDHDHDEAEYITLQFDDDEEIECEILGVFEFEGKEYIVCDPGDDTGEVFIYGYNEIDEENFELLDIEDDETFRKVSEEFNKLMLEE